MASRAALQVLFSRICQQQGSPYFQVRSDQIHVLRSPIDFYLSLCKGIRMSYRRILMSSLYVGEGPLERYLADLLFNKLEVNKHLRMTLVNDYHRSCRAGKLPTYRLLAPLKENFPPNANVTLSYFRPPRVPVGLGSIHTLNEMFGVQHMKICVFDDNVLLTGANMSENYFTERQDRYFVVTNCPEFADYCDDLVSMVAEVGVQWDEGGKFSAPTHCPDARRSSPGAGNRWREWASNRFKMHHFLHRPQSLPSFDTLYAATRPQHSAPSQTQSPQELVLAAESGVQWGKKLRTVGRAEDVFNFLKDLPSELNIVTGRGGWEESLTATGDAVCIFPTIQLGSLGLNDDLDLLKELIPALQEVTLASGYLNLPSSLTQVLRQMDHLKVICASPSANGFLGDGVKNWIPYLYRVLEQRLLKQLPNAQFYEYEKEGWTFHAKGLWSSLNNSPYFTAIGSSNYGTMYTARRSYLRDLEFQTYFWSECGQFSEKLKGEMAGIQAACVEVSPHTLQHSAFKCGSASRLLASALARFL